MWYRKRHCKPAVHVHVKDTVVPKHKIKRRGNCKLYKSEIISSEFERAPKRPNAKPSSQSKQAQRHSTVQIHPPLFLFATLPLRRPRCRSSSDLLLRSALIFLRQKQQGGFSYGAFFFLVHSGDCFLLFWDPMMIADCDCAAETQLELSFNGGAEYFVHDFQYIGSDLQTGWSTGLYSSFSLSHLPLSWFQIRWHWLIE